MRINSRIKRLEDKFCTNEKEDFVFITFSVVKGKKGEWEHEGKRFFDLFVFRRRGGKLMDMLHEGSDEFNKVLRENGYKRVKSV
ncbi:MAG: hypothetical protein PHY73_05510 [Candidatus Omnitrophica bacterium]|nr:hypothetical protein [Candidatus Omnitrophota bacterium]